MIDSTEILITPVKVEFLMTDQKTFNLRSQFIHLFQRIKKVDSTLAVLIDDSVWFTSKDFPVDD